MRRFSFRHSRLTLSYTADGCSGKSGAQVALKWILQRNASFTTSASSAEFFKQDITLFDFKLSSAEMKKLDDKSQQ